MGSNPSPPVTRHLLEKWENEMIKLVVDNSKTKIPVVLGELWKTSQIRIVCPVCGQHHFHGRVNGHRVAHCVPAQPDSQGYIVLCADLPPGTEIYDAADLEFPLEGWDVMAELIRLS